MLVAARIELCLSNPPQLHTPPGQSQAPPSYTVKLWQPVRRPQFFVSSGSNFLRMAPRRQQPLAPLVIPRARIWPPHKTNWHPPLQKFHTFIINAWVNPPWRSFVERPPAKHRHRRGYFSGVCWLAPMITHQRWYRQRPKHHAPPRSHSHAIHYAPSNPFSGGCAPKVSWSEISRGRSTDATEWRNRPSFVVNFPSFISTFGEKSRFENSSQTYQRESE